MWSIQKLENQSTYSGLDVNILFMIAGDASIQSLENSFHIPKKSFLYFDNTFKVTSTSPFYEGYVLTLKNDLIKDTLPIASSFPKNYQINNLRNIPLVKSLLFSLSSESKDNVSLIMSYLTIIFEKMEESLIQKNEDSLFNNFVHLIEENIENNYCAAAYAEMLNIPLKKLINEVKKETDATPCFIISQHVIKKAKELLTTTKDSSKTIAYQLGFREPYYFIKYFKRNVGVTPTQYRKQY
ncbi:AraC-type DNA-binding protein [Tenacibaculum sp. MAR_2009_124]|uniref:helix-turn-helix domain-containing protein n=1 Tax=Tenacibaculum sp. MAR_2009_124 TaxID=1250059 RepID=UPI000894A2EB|nr:AraC family transcriptional regulator [Tenacibaculum sp. MAR_2009_124]SEB36797.1 AraC-type DNA-binding protein [Tenacibaculum sp. MAR_2009_124]